MLTSKQRAYLRGLANTIDTILERKNSLIRPPVSNIDNLLIVVSTTDPKPNFYVIDNQFVSLLYNNGIII